MRTTIVRRWTGSVVGVAVGAAGLAGSAGCADPGHLGETMMVVQTDLSLPKDVDSVRIEVLEFGKPQLDQTYEKLGANDAIKIPASLGVLIGKVTSTPVTLRVIAYQNQRAKILRESVTTVPDKRLAMLRFPLQWLCWDQVKDNGDPSDPLGVTADCPQGQSCIDGTCQSSDVDATTLPTYTDQSVFGGGTGDGDGSCLDVAACFNGATTVKVADDCSIPATGDENVALLLESTGICGPSGCFIALDAESAGGFKTNARTGKRTFPQAICDRLNKGTALGVVTSPVSSVCPQKSTSVPTCGPWSASGRALAPGEVVPAVLANGQNHPYAIAVDGNNVHWTNRGTGSADGQVKRISLTGGPTRVLADMQSSPRGIAVDGTGKVYWANGGTGKADGSIAMINGASATAMVQTLSSGLTAPEGVVISGTSFYWSSFDATGTISKSALGGTSGKVVIGPSTNAPQNYPYRLAADKSGLFWTNEGSAAGGDGSVAWSAFGASMTTTAIALKVTTPRALALDLDASGNATAVYWASFAESGALMTAPIANGKPGAATVVADKQAFPNGVAVDGTYVYWTSRGDGTVLRLKKGATGTPETIAAHQYAPGAITADATSLYWINEGSSSAADGAVVRMDKPK